MKNKYIIILSFVACLILYLLEQVFLVNYLVKTTSKLILFTIIPIIYMKYIKKTKIKNALNLSKLAKNDLKLGVILGSLSFITVQVVYIIFKEFIDFSGIINELQTKSKITPTNFIFVGLYITFVNSFLEEFFFRGFIFLNLYELNKKKTAYFYSAVLFSVYHIAIFKTWFDPGLILLTLLGLITIGLVFNYLNTKSKNFINSWLVHLMADSIIIIIGMKLFGIF
ncbi:MAG: hypothetical protein K0Q49_1247 [Haloplasmataceae bacterium]|jgi:membrane protease YdiL (CAAX protease family)|nr:hypothetical protein [Haloplasmataceae bacterium]